MTPILGYWKLRGLGQPIRLLLQYAGEDYKEENYEVTGSSPNWNREQWTSKKDHLDLDFPNLPYYKDGDIKVTQSLAILFYIGAKYNLNGKTLKEQTDVTMIQQELSDWRTRFIIMSYAPDDDTFAKIKSEFIAALPAKLKQFSDFLKEKKFIVSDEATSADFNLYDFLDCLTKLDPTCLDKFANLKEYLHRIEEIPSIKAYMASPNFIAFPINNHMARFGSITSGQ